MKRGGGEGGGGLLQMTLFIVAKLLPDSWSVWCEKRVHHLLGAEFLA